MADAGPPEQGFILQAGHYVTCACLTLCVWDWLISLSDEHKIFRGAYPGIWWRSVVLNVAYLVCRLSSLAYTLVAMVLIAASFDSCNTIGRTIMTLNAIVTPTTGLLFYFRVSAVYLGSRVPVIFFGLCWLVVLACYMYDSISAIPLFQHIPGSKNCGAVLPGLTDASSYTSIAAFDTLVYLAISWRLSSGTKLEGRWTDRLVSFANGKGLYNLSRIMLQDGQLYYFTTVGINVTLAACFYGRATLWLGQFTPLGATLPAIMACRVFRKLKLKATDEVITMPTLGIASNVMSTDTLMVFRRADIEESWDAENGYEMMTSFKP